MSTKEKIVKLYGICNPKHVVTTLVYFNETKGEYSAWINVNKKPTGDVGNLIARGLGSDENDVIRAFEMALDDVLSQMKNK